jgi:hypothetical protein
VLTAQAGSKTLMNDMHPATFTCNVVTTFLMTTADRQASAQLSIIAQLGMMMVMIAEFNGGAGACNC